MNNINNALKLLYSSSYWDIDKIKNVMVDLLQERAQISQQWAKEEQQYELSRAKLFIEYKEEKKELKNKMTEKEIETISKLKSLNKYKETIAYARVLKEYIDMLKSLKIDLMHQNKNDSF